MVTTGEITKVKLQKISNGRVRYMVSIPKVIVNILSLEKGDVMGISIVKDSIVFRPTNNKVIKEEKA